jgi:hypothetical protein
VLALEEPQRSLVLAIWFEGLSVTEAGRRLGLSARVAKLRLDSAHENLRRRLDRKLGGREVWSALFWQWTKPAGLAVASAGSAGVVVWGGLLVSTKWIASGVAALVLASAAWWLWPPKELVSQQTAGASELALSAVTPPAQGSALPVVATGDARETAIAPVPEAAVAAASESKPRWLVRGRISGGPTDSWEQTRLTAVFLGQYNIPDNAESRAADDGSFELDVTAAAERWLRDTPPSELLLTAEHPLSLRSEVRAAFASAVSDPSGKDRVFECDVVFAINNASQGGWRLVM